MNNYEQALRLSEILAKLNHMEEKFQEMDERLEKIETYLQRQKGFIGGILFVASCVAWAVSFIKDWWK